MHCITISHKLRYHTHTQSNEQGLYTCIPTASIFICFPLKVHHPPLESSESHAGGAVLKVCQRGEAPGPGLESPIATQSPRQRTSPVRSNNREGKKRGEGRCPLETWCPSTRCFKITQILFHWGNMCEGPAYSQRLIVVQRRYLQKSQVSVQLSSVKALTGRCCSLLPHLKALESDAQVQA